MAKLFTREQLLCSICLEVFIDPVTTPCGHNSCKSCLTQCWETSQRCYCPLCNQTFTKKPKLNINTTLRDVAENFKKSGFDKPEIICDACTGAKLKALKSCLDCGLSLCASHLESHNYQPNLKNHKQIDPEENLQDYICQKHKRPLMLFCKDDETCVCLFCPVTDHKNHNTVPIEEASDKLKVQLKTTQKEIQQMIQDRIEKTEDIKCSLERCKKSKEEQISHGNEVFNALINSIEEKQDEMLNKIEEMQNEAERQAKGLIEELEQEMTIYPSMCSFPHNKNWTEINTKIDFTGETVRKTLSQLQKTINNNMNKEIEKLEQKSQQKAGECSWFNKHWPFLLLLMMLLFLILTLVENEMKIQSYAVNITLDPDTAHPALILSQDRKQVAQGNNWQELPYTPKRFAKSPCVLGKQGFNSGRFYFEVQVSGKTKWVLGVASKNINRKGPIFLTPKNGYWTLGLRDRGGYTAFAGPSVLLTLRKKPEKVGVFVDYEESLVAFYNADTRSLIYSFSGQSFTKTLYPFFSPELNEKGNTAPLIILN
ncbi:bloodthirsty-related gene family, member 9 [Trichomycterus rosablanca]|uniref:bloodthirsty-related gene family, member 9 n=1 Tax=Trichomycterus rosablanca TaxID=2290929 RepID=UPI002F35D453